MIDITFSVNEYDRDGDVTKSGIFFHFGDTRVWICEEPEGLSDVAAQVESIKKEIQENY